MRNIKILKTNNKSERSVGYSVPMIFIMPAISVITPVYNVEKYIRKCLDSIVNQTLRDIEIICIDDGSTDSSSQILDEYAAVDSRVKVIHKQNEGYGKAMNDGLAVASGEYIGIVESDDWVAPNMFEDLYNAAKTEQLDFVKSDYYLANDSTVLYRKSLPVSGRYDWLITQQDAEPYFEMIAFWTGIYRTQFLKKNNIRFNNSPGASYQDLGFWMLVGYSFKKAKYLNKAYYYYRQNNPFSSVKNKGKMMAVYYECDHVEDALKEQGKLQNVYSHYNYLRMCHHRVTFNRIDDSLKREYASVIIEDYHSRKDNIKDFSEKNTSEIIAWLEKLSNDPDKYCSDFIEIKNKIRSQIESAERIAIYGTGMRASSVFFNLDNAGKSDRISCFIMTKKNDQNTFCSKNVFEIGEYSYSKDDLVIIAVKKASSAYNEIETLLADNKFNNFIDSEMINIL